MTYLNPSTQGKSYLATFFLSLFLGVFGADRFYLQKYGTGFLKLITFGGFGLWWLIDVVLLAFTQVSDKSGTPLVGYEANKKVALIGIGGFAAFALIASLFSPEESPDASGLNSPSATASPSASATESVTPSPSPSETLTEEPTPTPTAAKIWEPGMYVAGSEMPKGVYRTDGYWARLKDSGDILDNDLISGCGYNILIVTGTEDLIELSGSAIALKDLPKVDPIAEGLTCGTYVVGKDLKPGRYRITDDMPYAARLDSRLEIIDNALNDNSVIMTISSSDTYFTFDGDISRID